MARNTVKNKELREQSETRIIETAIVLFSKQGYAATKTTDIVREAGISQGLLYHYYSEKKLLYQACLKECIKRTEKFMKESAMTEGTAMDKINALSKRLLTRLSQSDVLMYQFLLLIRVSLEPGNEELLKDYDEIPLSYVVDIIKQGQGEQTIVKGDLVTLATLYWATVKGICIHMASQNIAYAIPDYSMVNNLLASR